MRVLIIPTPPAADAPVTSGIARYLTTLVRHAPTGTEYAYLDAADAAYGNPYTTPRKAESPVGEAVGARTGQSATVGTRGRGPSAIRLLLGYAREAWRLSRVLRGYRRRADLIHVNFVGCEIQTVAARLAGFRRIVTTVHNLPGEDAEARRWPRRVIEWLSFACASHHIVVSEAVYSAWHARVGLSRRRVTCVYNGMDAAVAQGGGEPRSDGHVTFGICARLHPMKGHAVLLDAFDRVRRQCPSARLLIAGDGPLWESIASEIQRLGLTGHVDMLGHVNDTLQFMARLDVHVHPSVFLEAMPYAVIEAMFAGVPQIVSDVGGAQEVIAASRGGGVVPREDPAALAVAMLTYAGDGGARLAAGRQAREYAHRHLTAQHMVRQSGDVYRDITGRTGGNE